MKKQNINPKGFTIIEVILVLAIGSLIILMALVALPSLQAAQRDTQRKNDYATLESAITSYTSNNRGKLPPDCQDQINSTTGEPNRDTDAHCKFIATYIKDSWADPQKGYYEVKVTATLPSQPQGGANSGKVYIVKSAKCNGETAVIDTTLGNRRYAIWAFLESGTYCQAN